MEKHEDRKDKDMRESILYHDNSYWKYPIFESIGPPAKITINCGKMVVYDFFKL